MTTTVVKTIGSGGDYTTLQAWEDACPASLVAVDQVWQGQCLNTGSLTTTSNPLAISGTTTDATRYLELTTASGASFRDRSDVQTNHLCFDSALGANITVTGAYGGWAITCSTDFTRISNLMIAAQGDHTAGVNMSLGGSGTATCDINNCIIEAAYALAPGSAPLKLYGANQVVRNSLIVQRGSGMPCIAIIQNGAKAYNCTFVVPSDKTPATVAVSGKYGAPTYRNCVFAGVAGIWSDGTAPSFSACYTDATSTAGVTGVIYSDFRFASGADATRDFRIQSSSSLVDSGATDATNAATDIAGTTRPQGSAYDVGAWEYKAGASSVTVNITGRALALTRGALAASVVAALTGKRTTLTPGVATVATSGNVSVGITGQGLALAQGAIPGTVLLAVPMGLSLTTTPGLVVAGSDVSVVLAGQKMTVAAGLVGASAPPDVTVNIAGQALTITGAQLVPLTVVAVPGLVVDMQNGTLTSIGGLPSIWSDIAPTPTVWSNAE